MDMWEWISVVLGVGVEAANVDVKCFSSCSYLDLHTCKLLHQIWHACNTTLFLLNRRDAIEVDGGR